MRRGWGSRSVFAGRRKLVVAALGSVGRVGAEATSTTQSDATRERVARRYARLTAQRRIQAFNEAWAKL